MSKKLHILWPLSAVVLAALCAAARLWQRKTAFEGDLSLPIPYAPATVALIALMTLSMAGLLLLARKQPLSPALTDEHLLPDCRNDHLFPTAAAIGAFLCFIAAVLLFRDGFVQWRIFRSTVALEGTVMAMNNGVLMLATGITTALAFPGLLCAGRAAARGTASGRLGVLMPAANGGLWLMEAYRIHAADPVRWNYAPLLIAIVCGSLFYLDWAALTAGKAAPRRLLWLAAMTVIFSAIALAGRWAASSALLLITQLITALAMLCRLPHNLIDPPEPVPAPAEENTEDDTHE